MKNISIGVYESNRFSMVLWPSGYILNELKKGFLRHYCPTFVTFSENNFVMSFEFVQSY